MTILVQEMVYGVCKRKMRKYTLVSGVCFLSLTAGGTHQLWVSPAMRREKHTPESGVFSCIKDLFLCVVHIHLKLHNEGKAIHW